MSIKAKYHPVYGARIHVIHSVPLHSLEWDTTLSTLSRHHYNSHERETPLCLVQRSLAVIGSVEHLGVVVKSCTFFQSRQMWQCLSLSLKNKLWWFHWNNVNLIFLWFLLDSFNNSREIISCGNSIYVKHMVHTFMYIKVVSARSN